ncbi:GUN4 domain-containing protein [Aerosakkonema funiforme]
MEVEEITEEETPKIYRKLQSLLASQEWKEADEETAALIFKLSGQQYEMSATYAESVSSREFNVIDKLWLKYSKGKFGFSVQKSIWLELSGKISNDSEEIYKKFCEQVGWRVKSGCLLSSYLNFSLDAPKGHLPVQVAGQGWSAASFLSSLNSVIID